MGVQSSVNGRVSRLIRKQVAEGGQIGVQVCAYKDGEKVVDAWAGRMGPDDYKPVKPDSLFCCWSTTKGVAATALHICADRGLIDYKERVSKYWPAFGKNGKEKITVEQAISHQAGLYMTPSSKVYYDWDAGLRYIEKLKPAYEPGTAVGYHAVTFGIIVGGIIQAVTGVHIRDFIKDEIATPLGVSGEMFVGIPNGVEERLTTIEAWDLPRILTDQGLNLAPDWYRAMPNDLWSHVNDMDWRKACMPAANGHFTARALAKMYAALASGGSIKGVTLMSPERVKLMSRLVTDKPDIVLGMPNNKSLGFMLGGVFDGVVETMGPKLTTFGHGGAGGSIAFADPEACLSVAVTLNKMEFMGTRTTEICNLIRDELSVNQ